MLDPRAVRTVRVAAPIAGIMATLLALGWIYWPAWQEYRAVEGLLAAVRDHDLQSIDEQVQALKTMHRGQAAVPSLVRATRSEEGRVRQGAALALGKLAPEVRAAAPSILREMDEPDRISQDAAGNGQPTAETIAALVEALASSDPVVRELATELIFQLPPQAQDAIPALIAAMHSEEGSRRGGDSATVGGSQDAVPALVQALESGDPSLRRLAAMALGELAPQAPIAIRPLVAALRDEDDEVSQAAADALAAVGSAAEVAVPDLTQLLDDADSALAVHFARALWQIARRAEPAVARLIEALADDEPSVRVLAVRFLAEIGPDAAPALPALAEAIQDPDPQVSQEAAWAILQLE